MTGFVFGGGLHLHSSIGHEHENADHHTHTMAAHVHNTVLLPSPGFENETISSLENEHQHPVPLVQLIAVRASAPTTIQSFQYDFACSADLPRRFFPDPAISILFVFPHETSPPLRSLTGSSDSGRSPPTA